MRLIEHCLSGLNSISLHSNAFWVKAVNFTEDNSESVVNECSWLHLFEFQLSYKSYENLSSLLTIRSELIITAIKVN